MSIEFLQKANSVEDSLPHSDAGSETQSTTEPLLHAFLESRYRPDRKILDLNALKKNSTLPNIGTFGTSRDSKFFPALMKAVEKKVTGVMSKEEHIIAVSLADNALSSIEPVSSLAQTLPALRGLDLSNNQIRNLTALEGWRRRFPKLNELILSGNPIEAELPSYRQDLLKWYPCLTILNGTQVRSPEEVDAIMKGKLPLPILPASFRDERSIGENFVKGFFECYDFNREYLLNSVYDVNSKFSLSVNTEAPRPTDLAGQPSPKWASYIQRSRNLTILNHLPAKKNRLYTGVDEIRYAFSTLPRTIHPNLIEERQKWCIECHTIPSVADHSTHSESNSPGMLIVIHGEFMEVDGDSVQITDRRSFDRTFVIRLGGPHDSLVVSDILVLRSYGGNRAWRPEVAPLDEISQTQLLHQVLLTAVPGYAMPGFAKTDEVVEWEKKILQLSLATRLTLNYSAELLEFADGNYLSAMDTYLGSKVWHQKVESPENYTYM